MLLALMLCAAPLLPDAPFPKSVKAPLDVPGSAKAKPMNSSATVALMKQLIAGRSTLPNLTRYFGADVEQTRAAMDKPIDFPRWQFYPLGRVEAGGCVEWFGEWSAPGPDTIFEVLVAFTSKPDRALIDAAELGFSGGSAGTNTWETSLRVAGDGTVTSHRVVRYFIENLAGPLTGTNPRRLTDTAWTLQPDCHLTPGPSSWPLLTGHVDAKGSREEMWIHDDGKTVRAQYTAKGGELMMGTPDEDWVPLSVDSIDRAAGSLTVRFGKSKQPYPLKWNAEHSELSCLNPDGGIQMFSERAF